MGKKKNIKGKKENENKDAKETIKPTLKDNIIFFAIISVPTLIYLYLHFDQFQDAYYNIKKSGWSQTLKFLLLFLCCWALFYVISEFKSIVQKIKSMHPSP